MLNYNDKILFATPVANTEEKKSKTVNDENQVTRLGYFKSLSKSASVETDGSYLSINEFGCQGLLYNVHQKVNSPNSISFISNELSNITLFLDKSSYFKVNTGMNTTVLLNGANGDARVVDLIGDSVYKMYFSEIPDNVDLNINQKIIDSIVVLQSYLQGYTQKKNYNFDSVEEISYFTVNEDLNPIESISLKGLKRSPGLLVGMSMNTSTAVDFLLGSPYQVEYIGAVYFNALGADLTQKSIDSILIFFDNPNTGVNYPNNYINLTGGTAVPSAAGLVAKSNLIAKGWNVLTN